MTEENNNFKDKGDVNDASVPDQGINKMLDNLPSEKIPAGLASKVLASLNTQKKIGFTRKEKRFSWLLGIVAIGLIGLLLFWIFDEPFAEHHYEERGEWSILLGFIIIVIILIFIYRIRKSKRRLYWIEQKDGPTNAK